jgi:hypothetical protein
MEPLDQAILLLENPKLVWSQDFEAIRYHLVALLEDEKKSLGRYQSTDDLVAALIDDFSETKR